MKSVPMKPAVFLLLIQLFVQVHLLSVTVFYEALCPDSRRFIVNQLYPALKTLKEDLRVQYVPFGKSDSFESPDGKIEFECQHGTQECHANKIQACVIKNTPDQHRQSVFINCAMADWSPSDDNAMRKCAQHSDISWEPIEQCLATSECDLLLLENEKLTNAVVPQIKYVPTIILNGDSNGKSLQEKFEHNFLATACGILEQEEHKKPAGCP